MYKNHIYFKLGEILNNNKIKYFVFKGSYKLDEPYSGNGDLDIFVMPCDTSEFIRLAQNIGFVYLENVAIFRENYTRDLFYFDSESTIKYHLHLHTQINFGNKITSNINYNIEDLLLKKKDLDTDFNLFILPPELDLILIGARKKHQKGKNWIKKKEFKKVLNKIIIKYKKNNTDILYLKEYFSNSIFESVFKILNEENLEEKFKLNTFKYRKIPNFIFLARFFHKVFKKFFGLSFIGTRRIPFAGKSIVLVGIDGSGKSSSMDLLNAFFSKFMDVEKVTLGSGQSGASWIRRIIFFIFGTKAFLKGHKGTRNFENKNKNKKISFLYSIWVLLCLFDKYKNLKKLHLSLLQGKLVLVDRWIQDIDLNFADAPRLNLYIKQKGFVGFVARYEKEIFKKSSLIIPSEIIILDITAENSLIRKPDDLTLEQAKNNSKNMINFNWSEIANTSVINANLSKDKVLKSLISIIFKSLKV